MTWEDWWELMKERAEVGQLRKELQFYRAHAGEGNSNPVLRSLRVWKNGNLSDIYQVWLQTIPNESDYWLVWLTISIIALPFFFWAGLLSLELDDEEGDDEELIALMLELTLDSDTTAETFFATFLLLLRFFFLPFSSSFCLNWPISL